jgi:diketogulonate reductase-like aldo/keto reductase
VHIDTALIYANQKGVGAALKESGRARDTFFITTKIPGGLNKSATEAALQQDLDELQLDFVDLMLIHYPCTMDAKAAGGKASRQTMWKAVEAFQKAGKAKAIGVSHYCQRHLKDIMEIAEIPPAVNQVQFHVGMGTAGGNATDDKAFCEAHGILYESFSPLCGPCGTKELINGSLVTGIGKKHGKSGAQVSLRWQVQQGIPVIPKTDSPKHLAENLDLFTWSLTESEMAALTAAKSPAVAGAGDGTSGDCTIA